MHICLDSYRSIIFDFDGVIVDSNGIKKKAISDAVKGIISVEDAKNFVKFFTQNNGLPRIDKIKKHIPSQYVAEVLDRYEAYLALSLPQAPLIPGVKRFIDSLAARLNAVPLIVLSGGVVSEIEKLLDFHNLASYFDGIYAAPKNKAQNLSVMKPSHPVIFFGDSEIDYRVASDAGMDFVFVFGATDWVDWRSTIESDPSVFIIKDFQ